MAAQTWIPQRWLIVETLWATVFLGTLGFYLFAPREPESDWLFAFYLAVQKLMLFLSAGAFLGGLWRSFSIGLAVGLALFAIQAFIGLWL